MQRYRSSFSVDIYTVQYLAKKPDIYRGIYSNRDRLGLKKKKMDFQIIWGGQCRKQTISNCSVHKGHAIIFEWEVKLVLLLNSSMEKTFLTLDSFFYYLFFIFFYYLFFIFFYYLFFAPGVGFPLYPEIFVHYSQWFCSASGSLWEMPDSNPGPLPQKSGALAIALLTFHVTTVFLHVTLLMPVSMKQLARCNPDIL